MTATPALAQNAGFSISFGSPGYSQDYGHDRGYGYGNDLRVKAQRLEQRIDRLEYNGRITRREARSLAWQLDEYRRLEWRYARDGLNRREHADLSYRLDRIQAMIRQDRRDRW
ncbi:MAG: hypothetical protein FD125_2480 [bacterium]|nr:MAG: hypothetical protein FD125_2480 [bacterium]